jgi:hypothetical protein
VIPRASEWQRTRVARPWLALVAATAWGELALGESLSWLVEVQAGACDTVVAFAAAVATTARLSAMPPRR